MADPDVLRAMVAAELARHRAIIHIDLEQLRLALSPDAPLAVQQWQGLIAVNYPARRRGVKRMDTVREAREKCPELMLVHVPTFTDNSPAAYHQSPSASTHKACLDEYRRVSRKIMELFRRLCPTMGKASIDEAYLDVSEQMRARILEDLDRGALELVDGRGAAAAAAARDLRFDALSCDGDADAEVPLPAVYWVTASRKGKEKEPAGTGAAAATEYGVLVGDAPDVSYGWADLLLRYAAEFARDARGTLLRELGYRASAGIAHNRFLAKIGSGLNKPDQQTVFPQSQVDTFLQTFPIASIPSLGGKLGALVVTAFDAETAGDLARYTQEQMAFKLGPEHAQHVYNRCRGIDDSPVVDTREPSSFSSTKNFSPQPVADMAQLDRWVSMNSMDLWARVLEEWETRRRWPRSLTVSYTTSGQPQRSKTVPFPPREQRGARGSPDVVADAARACLAAIASGGAPGAQQRLFPLAAITLTAKSFQRGQAGAALMERWLARPRTGAAGAGRAAPQLQDSHDSGGVVGAARTLSYDGDDDYDDAAMDSGDDGDSNIPALQQPRLSTVLSLASQPTTHVQLGQKAAPLHALVPPVVFEAALPPQPLRAGVPSPLQSAATLQPVAGHGGNAAPEGTYPSYYLQPANSDCDSQPELVANSGDESCDSELSCLRTPVESGSEASGDEESGDEESGGEESGSDEGGGAAADASIDNGDDATAAETRESSRPPPSRASRAAAAPSYRRQPSVYIQPNTDQDCAARYGEGYKNISVDPVEDIGLELAAPGVAQADSGDGFIPALIAATRRKRAIQIVRFQHSVDCPGDAIEASRDDLEEEEKAKRGQSSKKGESSRMAGAGGKARSAAKAAAPAEEDEDSSSDDGVDEVLNVAIRAMLESLSASQTVMQIHCPQCPESAPTVSSCEWETHSDWHMARRLQERELRHESVARHIRTAFSGRSDRSPAPKRPRPGGDESPRRRQQTITEAWQ
ncbi:N-acetyltransferase eso1 [Coemansia biformis]|uniref:DNA polymerase eta n=1 Tax=Coemansia biformis TaxID=1286918 RepID=A0A9W7YFR0_9FUNG|nr:N-acetyltransferase eso1 [Coemansia biformis]